MAGVTSMAAAGTSLKFSLIGSFKGLSLSSSSSSSSFFKGDTDLKVGLGPKSSLSLPLRRLPFPSLTIQMAHKKGAGSTKNGRDSRGQRLGVKIFGNQLAKPGAIIVRQRGTKVCPPPLTISLSL
uniref:Uncharacterized protein MANES_15G161500 n=1 Tax=Rhizophora mucronata TaxID=61149 RepID=A0A2P2MCF3_RHIMU